MDLNALALACTGETFKKLKLIYEVDWPINNSNR